jgi:hypothetical protein
MASPYAAVVQAGAGTTHAFTAVANNKIRLMGFGGAMAGTGTVQFKSTGGTALTGAMNAAANTPFAVSSSTHSDGIGETPVGEGLDLISITGAFNGWVVAQYVPG